ncbi:MAG: sulfite oxidase [Dehalococcoidia bacterium]
MTTQPENSDRHGKGSGGGSSPHDRIQRPLVLIKQEPRNAEATLDALREARTPLENFYMRNHFAMPRLSVNDWQLQVTDAVRRPRTLSLDDVRRLPSRTITATLECAGNDRGGLAPLPKGESWTSGAVSTGEWSGVALRDVLDQAGLDADAIEILAIGADRGKPQGSDEELSFARSLPRGKALDPDTLLAYELNGAPLPHEHGGPVRLLVPDWYGMASVKWLLQISGLRQPFGGYFQRENYVLELPGQAGYEPLREMRVKSLITNPAAGEVLALGTHRVSGIAWSGHGAIRQVEVSTEGEGPWQPAHLLGKPTPHAWRQWEFPWEVGQPGRHALRARATDLPGNRQPDLPQWNRLGYANNAIQVVMVEIAND